MSVFISHSSKDAWVAKQIANQLSDRGIDTFLDENDLETGDVFDDELRDRMRQADEVLILLSPSGSTANGS
jgi:TIR domain-containing protein